MTDTQIADLRNSVKFYNEAKAAGDDDERQQRWKDLKEILASSESTLPDLAGLNDLPDAEFIEALRSALGERRLLPDSVTGNDWQEIPPDRQWLVKDWLPTGELVLLSGPGETGKSLLLLQLAAALACDRQVERQNGGWLPSLDVSTKANPPALCDKAQTVVMAGWEDDRAELLRRRNRLTRFGHCEWAGHSSINEHLHVYPMRGYGPVYGVSEGHHIATRGELTATGHALLDRCEALHAGLLVLDPVSLGIATNENDRALVSMALETLAGWAAKTGCAVIMAGHPAKVVEGEGADYSGSTAWRGLVRALWTLRLPDKLTRTTKATEAEARQLKKDYRERQERVAALTLNKSNYSFGGRSLTLETRGKCAAWVLRDELDENQDNQDGGNPY